MNTEFPSGTVAVHAVPNTNTQKYKVCPQVRHVGSDASNAALLRSLALRDNPREGGGDQQQRRRDYESEGRLRRSMSEELLSDVGLGEVKS